MVIALFSQTIILVIVSVCSFAFFDNCAKSQLVSSKSLLAGI